MATVIGPGVFEPLCELSKERCKAQADKNLVEDIENYLASADGVVEMASATKGSGLRQHHIVMYTTLREFS